MSLLGKESPTVEGVSDRPAGTNGLAGCNDCEWPKQQNIEYQEMKSDRQGKHRRNTASPPNWGCDSGQEGSASTHDDSAVMIFMEHQHEECICRR